MASKRGKRSFASLQVASESGQIMRFYLQRQFFSRFKRIVFNTVHCNFSDTARQLAVRKEKRISNSRTLEQCRSKYFLAPEAIAQSIHRELWLHGRGTYRFLILLPSSPRRFLNLGIFWSTVCCLLPIGASVFSESRIEASGNRCRHCSRESAEML